jgi:pimeloyl-ACP methyl ester carboxylesterase
MEPTPRLIDVSVPSRPEGVAIVLHGGAARRGTIRVSPAQLSVLRMIPIARRVARAGRGRLAVFRLLNSRRGWDATHTPVDDTLWALAQVRSRLGELPVCLVGHSLGGRAALLALGAPGVRGAVALAPWVLPADVPAGLAGQRALIVHGTHDRIASPQRSAALADALGARADVRYVAVEGAKHAMLRRHGVFSRLAAEFAVETVSRASARSAAPRGRAGDARGPQADRASRRWPSRGARARGR